MTDAVNDVLWTEKYRPTRLIDLALEDETRAVLAAYIEGGSIPHLLLAGPPGSGKTTVARILTKALDCRQLVLNASSERGIEVVREKIGSFVTAMTDAAWNVVFLDEADAMTADAQTAMRNLIESYAERARFILTANSLHKIIGSIQSRCQVFIFGRPPLKERFRILAQVLKAEKIEATPKTILGYAEKYPDMRRMLMASQKAYLGNGKKDLPEPADSTSGATGADVLALIEARNWTGLRRLTTSGEFDPQHAMRETFWAVPDEHPRVGFLRHVLARGVHESGFTPDPIVLFLGVCAEAIEGL